MTSLEHFSYDFEADFHDETNKNAWFSRLIGDGRRVLEVGCATGFAGEHLARAQSCAVVGIELVPEAAEKARSRNCYEQVIVGDVLDPAVVAQAGDGFDFILFGDVLEHLHDPVAALTTVRPLLAPSGHILICVPNICHWSMRSRMLRGQFDYTETGILDRTHLRFFNVSTATAMVEEAGFEILTTAGVVWLPSSVAKIPHGAHLRLQRVLGQWRPNLFYGQILLDVQPHPDV